MDTVSFPLYNSFPKCDYKLFPDQRDLTYRDSREARISLCYADYGSRYPNPDFRACGSNGPIIDLSVIKMVKIFTVIKRQKKKI